MENTKLIIPIADPVAVFKQDEVEALIERIEAEVSDVVFDIQTDKGRKACASWNGIMG